MKGLKIALFSGLISLSAITTIQNQAPKITNYEQIKSINYLKEYLLNKGFEIDSLFLDQKFEIYQNIDFSFKNSPELKAKNAYQSAPKEIAEKIFEEEYKNYKEQIGFDNKKDKIKDFIDDNLEQLLIAEQEYNIPKEIIAATIGIESNFGKNKGKYYAFNVYVSMYIKNYRQEFALNHLEELLKFCDKTGNSVFLKSSYAGAIGYCQFLPYSLNNWFIGKDIEDINNNILSVANYLSHFNEGTGSLEDAVLKYNPSEFYARSVFELAKY